MAIDGIAQNLRKIFVATKVPLKKTYIFDSLIGSIKLDGNKVTNYAENIDEIYLTD
jgi:hypothetical protein